MKSGFLLSKNKWLSNADILILIVFCSIPLFLSFPYRVNIFLSWEGAYRLYLGQVPYKDFGLPMGLTYWVVPAIFFKIFGPYMLSLIKAQVLMNLICGLSFRGILKKIKIADGIRIAVMIIFCLSYILINFWPWYNNSVIIYELAGLNFLFGYFIREKKTRFYFLIAAAFFLFLSFFTKQDGGFLGFAIASALIAYHAIITKKWKGFFFFFITYSIIGFIIIYPFTKYGFGYWFNHGQPPHTARFSVQDLLNEIFVESQWIKFYLLLIAFIVVFKFRNNKRFFFDTQEMLFLILTLGILAEALIFGMTSYTPPDNNIFFHSFALAYILTGLSQITGIDINRVGNFIGLSLLILFWWSAGYWQYINRIIARVIPPAPAPVVTNDSIRPENVINEHTYMLNLDTTHYEDESTWATIDSMPAFRKIYLPPSTVAGIQRLKQQPIFKNKNAEVLNMTELTPLDYELGYKIETGENYPLWYHLGVCMFNKQCDEFCEKIKNKHYDIVMFENIPSLNNFYPFRIRDSLNVYYNKVDSFLAPRRPTNGKIYIYSK
ncbi:MAG: hypothetical protein JST21_05245 [Bacteroidetes bacterium]|nr:hypothetical protein [Bacteroidota bacterium]